jgi:CheY-like chemotaxis protein
VVNDILDIGPSSRGDVRPIITAVPVRELFDYVAATMQPVAKEATIALEITMPAAIPALRADSARLRRVLINLVSNAIRYNRPGGIAALSATAADGRVRIVVSDTGVGMDAQRQARLFEPFNWLGPAYTTAGGTGIGLALSRRLVEAMGGTIGFTSEQGHGSTFWVELPAEVAPAIVAGTAPPKREAAHGGCLLLYVEDNELSVLFMEGVVSTLAGMTILTATTAEQGLELAASRRPDVIVLDINLPGMNGYEMLTRLKAAPETKDIPVLALSASAMQRGAPSGFLTYFTKPVDVDALTAALHEAIAKAPRRRIDAAD